MELYQISQRIALDFSSRGVPPVVHATQYDANMRVVRVCMLASGLSYSVPDGYSVNIRLRKPDGTCVYNPALSVSGNTADIVLTQQMLCYAGTIDAVLEVCSGENVLASGLFRIDVLQNPVPENFIESTDEYKTIQQLAAEVSANAEIVSRNEPAIQHIESNLDLIKSVPTLAQEASANADAAQLYAEMAQQVSQGAVGYYATPEALRAAHTTAENGNWAIVGSTDTVWVWDADTGDWLDTSQHIDMGQYYTKAEVQTMVQGVDDGVKELKNRTRVNLLRPTMGTTTSNGVTCTNNGDGTYTLNGTATDGEFFTIASNIYLKGTYKLTGTPINRGNASMYDAEEYRVDTGGGVILEQDGTKKITIIIVAYAGTYNNVVFKPMLTTDLSATYDDFVSYEDSLQPGINTGLKMDLLWTNASPSSAFDAQTINIPNLFKYSAVYVVCELYSGYRKYTCELFLNQTGRIYVLTAVSDSGVGFGYPIASYYRFLSLNSDGIYFYDGIYGYDNVNTKNDSNTMVPYHIYGVK